MRRRDLIAATAAGVATLPLASGGGGPFPRPALAQTSAVGSVPTRRTHALSMLGEPALPADFRHFPWVNPDAAKGGEVALTALGSYDSFNFHILRGTSAVGLNLIYDQILKESADEPNTEYAHLAREIEVPADNRWIAFEFREEARWHDGRPVTADDAVWTFNALRQHGRPFYRAYWADVTEVVAEGPRRVVFRFRTGENRELGLILGQMNVLPRHWWEAPGRDFSRPTLEPPLGSGPYRIERHEPGRSVAYRRVEDWWARDLGTARGTANFGAMRYEYFRDATVALEAFKAGQIDFRTENIAKEWATGYDFPAARRGLVRRDEIRHELPTGMQGFAMNTRRPLFADRRVREALATVFDFEWMNANLFYGSYARTSSYFSNSDYASSGVPSGREREILEAFRGRVPDALFTEPFRVPGEGADARANARRALDLLRQAGWEVRDRRLANREGTRFEFEILLNGPSFERVALPYIQSLQRLGIEARARTVDPAQYQVRTDAFDFDMTTEVFGQSFFPGNEQRDYWTSAKASENGSRNAMGVRDPVVDEIVEMVVAAPDREELVARVRALDRVLLWGHYVVPHWHNRTFRIAWWDKFGRPERNPRYALGFDSWWVDPARERALAEARRSPA